MAETLLYCKNHPSTATRVRCSSCEEPICPRCMRQSAVGMKCPDCAALPRSALRQGNLRSYATGAVAAFVASAGAGLVLIWLGFGLRGLLLPLLAGAVSGAAARRASGLGHGRMQLAVAAAVVAGLAVGPLMLGVRMGALLSPSWLIGAGLAAVGAVFVVRR